MKQTELKRLKSHVKVIILITLTILQFSCSDDNENNQTQLTSKLYAIDGVGGDLKIVEVNPTNGNLISIFLDFIPMEARVYFDFTYLNTTNELIIRRNVFASGFEPQLIKINVDTKAQNIISSEDYSSVTAGNGKLFAFERSDNGLDSIELVEVNPENASTISIIETFNPVDNAPRSSPTGISRILYSYDTNQILVPRRTSFVSNAIDDLIKINANSGTKEIIKIAHYESIIVGRNGRLFAVKKDSDFYGIVEVDINNGEEIDIIKEFIDLNPFFDVEINFLGETSEILVYARTILYKINIDTKSEVTLSNTDDFYSYRSINVY